MRFDGRIKRESEVEDMNKMKKIGKRGRMNRKGDVPTILLFLVAFIFSIMALFVMVSFSGEFSGKSNEYVLMMENYDFLENYVIKKSEMFVFESINCVSETYGGLCNLELKGRLSGIAGNREFSVDGAEQFYRKLEQGDFILEMGGDGKSYEFLLKEIILKRQVGDNKIERAFDLKLTFDLDGKLVDKEIVGKVYK